MQTTALNFISETVLAEKLGVALADLYPGLPRHLPTSSVMVGDETYWLQDDINTLFVSVIKLWLEEQE